MLLLCLALSIAGWLLASYYGWQIKNEEIYDKQAPDPKTLTFCLMANFILFQLVRNKVLQTTGLVWVGFLALELGCYFFHATAMAYVYRTWKPWQSVLCILSILAVDIYLVTCLKL